MKMAKTEMRPEYKRSDFGTLERGKFFAEASTRTTVALIDPEMARAFPTSGAFSKAHLSQLALADETARITGRTKRAVQKRVAV